MRRFAAWLLVALTAVQLGCGGGGASAPSPPPQPGVSVSPGSASVRAGDTQQFNATVTGTTSTAVSWSVNGVAGGNATFGTISATGLYTAPAALPSPASVTVTAAAATASGSSAVSLLNPIPTLGAINPTTAGVGTFTITVTGDKFVQGAQITLGGAALTTTFVSPTLLAARVTVTQAQVGNVAVRVSNPDPGAANSGSVDLRVVSGTVVSARAAARFLEQSTFGPTAELITQVTQVGFESFLNDQFNAPASGFDDPVADAQGQFNNPDTLQRRWWTNALFGQDQLRQRMAFALHKIWVVSWVVVEDSRAFVRYLRMHQQQAFTNYRLVMENVTKDPAMGRYQDIANNDGAANRTVNCNENYGRELMQLFTVGLLKLNPDGTLQRDAQGQPIQAYDPVFTVEQNACAMTGWTYAKETPATRDWPRPPFNGAILEAVESHHDKGQKILIDNFVVPPNGTAQQDLTLTIDNLFNHPNMPPFVSRLLIQQFVTSNPSPAYVGRVAQAFIAGRFSNAAATFGSGQRGDLRAVIAAILLDPEARRGDTLAPNDPQLANDGKLKEPILFIAGVFRAIGAVTDGSQLSNNSGAGMGERLLYPPTVFSYFSPDYEIPGTTLLGPELNIQNTATTFARINFINTITCGVITSTNPCNQFSNTLSINYTPFAALAANPDAQNQLLDVLSVLMLRSNMTPELRASLLNAMNAVPNDANRDLHRARTAIYLVAASSQYQVQH